MIHNRDLSPQGFFDKSISFIALDEDNLNIRRMTVVIILATFYQYARFWYHELTVGDIPPLYQHASFPKYAKLHISWQLHLPSEAQSHETESKWEQQMSRKYGFTSGNQILYPLQVLVEMLLRQILRRDEPVVCFWESNAIVAAQNNLVWLGYLNYTKSFGGTRQISLRTIRHLPYCVVYLVLTSAPFLLADQHPYLPLQQDIDAFPQALGFVPVFQSPGAEQQVRGVEEQRETGRNGGEMLLLVVGEGLPSI